MFISFSFVILCIIHCINLTYNGRQYFKSALDRFCHLESLWVNGIWYVSSEHSFL